MFKALAEKWEKWGRDGMLWPFVHDPVKGKPSVTLLFFYISFMITTCAITVSSILLLISGNYLQATMMPTLFWLMSFVFYRLRRLDSVKINLQEQSFELDGGEDASEE
jgi:hypothetical protein